MKKEKAGFVDEYYFLENNHLTLGGGILTVSMFLV